MQGIKNSAMIARFSRLDAWLPGRRTFAAVMLFTDGWWVVTSVTPNV